MNVLVYFAVINKRCPFCPALFKVKSALETHLAAKHSEYSKTEINIDDLPDEEIDSASSPLGGETKVPISYGANANSTNSTIGAAATSPTPSTGNLISPFLHSLSTHAELESSLKKLYEESLKRYANEVQASQQNGGGPPTPNPNEFRFIKNELPSPTAPGDNPVRGSGGDCPLDLSKPVDLTRSLGKSEPMDTSFLDSQDFLSGESDEESLC
jgi:AT-binding transcription factor 1